MRLSCMMVHWRDHDYPTSPCRSFHLGPLCASTPARAWFVKVNARLDAQAEIIAWVLSQQPPEAPQPTMVVIIRESKQGWKLEGAEE